jgi:hypothetical protein
MVVPVMYVDFIGGFFGHFSVGTHPQAAPFAHPWRTAVILCRKIAYSEIHQNLEGN